MNRGLSGFESRKAPRAARPHALVVQGIGRLIPDQEIVGSIPAEGAEARISPVWEAVRKTAAGRFNSGPRLRRSVAQQESAAAP